MRRGQAGQCHKRLSSRTFKKKVAMKKSTQIRKLDRLLSGGLDCLSVQEKKSVLVEVIKQETPRPVQQDSRFVHRRFWVPALAVAATVVVFVFGVFDLSIWSHDDLQDGFVSRGGGQEDVSIELGCINKDKKTPATESSTICSPGDILAFEIRMTPPCRYFSAAALSPDGVLIWYFPSDTETSQLVEDKGVVQRGIVIGSEHGPGEYQLFAIFSHGPLTKADARFCIEDPIAAKPIKPKVRVKSFSVIVP